MPQTAPASALRPEDLPALVASLSRQLDDAKAEAGRWRPDLAALIGLCVAEVPGQPGRWLVRVGAHEGYVASREDGLRAVAKMIERARAGEARG